MISGIYASVADAQSGVYPVSNLGETKDTADV